MHVMNLAVICKAEINLEHILLASLLIEARTAYVFRIMQANTKHFYLIVLSLFLLLECIERHTLLGGYIFTFANRRGFAPFIGHIIVIILILKIPWHLKV